MGARRAAGGRQHMARALELAASARGRTSPNPMVGAVVVTHGQLARELVIAAEMIVGDLPHATSVSVGEKTALTGARTARLIPVSCP